jgi:tRNA (guanine-N7-)-methyltransferase
MSAAQKRSYESSGRRFCIPFGNEIPDYKAIYGNGRPLTVEIGFGMGIATAILAEQNPNMNYLGIEVHKPGIGRLIWEIEKRALSNIRIIEHDAVEVLEKMTASASISAFHIFFPDPWPKKRHHKRRLITRPFTDLLADRLAPGAYLYMVTDWTDYGDWALAELSASAALWNPYADCAGEAGNTGGFAPRQAWRPLTKFERKGLEKGHEVRELYFVRGSP